MGKDERLHLRLDSAARKKLQRACELTGLDEPSALRACVQAFIEHVEAHGGIWLPLAIVPKSEISSAAAPPGKALARGGQRTDGLKDVRAASGENRLTDSAPDSPHGPNETGGDRRQFKLPAEPARKSVKYSTPRARSTRGGVKKTIEREKGN